ncbi:MAG TPA: hypothetical protein PLA71_00430 [Saccharofermentans sp.]|nr:hypothetical protein [Saccharofermentans sp.]
MTTPQTKPHYVKAADLKAELVKFKETGTISEELGEMILKIARKIATRPNFSGYTYKDEFISDAVFSMLKSLDKINLDYNPFMYLSQITFNAFIGKINREKRVQRVKEAYRDEVYDGFEEQEQL